jgi:predicted Zn-dependent protease
LTGMEFSSAAIEISPDLPGGSGIDGEVPVLLHELGHAVGLGHFNGPEVMNPVDAGFVSYQQGDLAGLATLYHGQSCA